MKMGSRSLGQSIAYCRRRSCNFDEEMQDDELQVDMGVERATEDSVQFAVDALTVNVRHVHALDAVLKERKVQTIFQHEHCESRSVATH